MESNFKHQLKILCNLYASNLVKIPTQKADKDHFQNDYIVFKNYFVYDNSVLESMFYELPLG